MPPDAVAPRVSPDGASPEPRRDGERRARPMTSEHAVRTTPWVRLEAAAASARGKRREVNEDCFSALDGPGLILSAANAMPTRPNSECASATPASPNIISRRCRWIIGISLGFVALRFRAD